MVCPRILVSVVCPYSSSCGVLNHCDWLRYTKSAKHTGYQCQPSYLYRGPKKAVRIGLPSLASGSDWMLCSLLWGSSDTQPWDEEDAFFLKQLNKFGLSLSCVCSELILHVLIECDISKENGVLRKLFGHLFTVCHCWWDYFNPFSSWFSRPAGGLYGIDSMPDLRKKKPIPLVSDLVRDFSSATQSLVQVALFFDIW